MGFSLLLAVWAATQPVVNLHKNASSDSEVVSQTIYGTPLRELSRVPGWVRVEMPDRYQGWVDQTRLIGRRAPYASQGRTARVDSLFAHIYREPDVTRHAPLLTLPFETALELAGAPGERWTEVRLIDGRLAWIQTGDLAQAERVLTIPETIALARRFIGLPYTWGGTSSFGYDCSGFTQMLGRRRGLAMPRDASPQSRWEGSVPVAKEALAPGDLLYFGPRPERVTHTGLYLGQGEFIHATTHIRPVIQVSHLDEPHWSGLLVACRRPR